MLPTRSFATQSAQSMLEPFQFQRREVGEHDDLIEIDYCGVCHSDIHQARDEWGGARFPMVPGHEIVGRVTRTGAAAKRFKPGDLAGVGCFVDSCRSCTPCKQGLQQYCEGHLAFTYNSTEKDGRTPTYGGYSSQIVVHEDFVLKVSPRLPLERVAPLLCAGITTYSPLRHWKAGPGQSVAIVGLGGLGHMAVKLAASMGAEVTVLSSSKSKERDAQALGAHRFVHTASDSLGALVQGAGLSFNLMIDTVSAPHDLNAYLAMLKTDGTMVLLGVPPKATEVSASPLIYKRRRLAGSLIGGIPETQEMLDYCAKKDIAADVEVIPIQKINEAHDRLLKGDVRYRFVIDMKSL